MFSIQPVLFTDWNLSFKSDTPRRRPHRKKNRTYSTRWKVRSKSLNLCCPTSQKKLPTRSIWRRKLWEKWPRTGRMAPGLLPPNRPQKLAQVSLQLLDLLMDTTHRRVRSLLLILRTWCARSGSRMKRKPLKVHLLPRRSAPNPTPFNLWNSFLLLFLLHSDIPSQFYTSPLYSMPDKYKHSCFTNVWNDSIWHNTKTGVN